MYVIDAIISIYKHFRLPLGNTVHDNTEYLFSLERDYAIMMVNAKSLFPSKKLWFFVTYTGTIKYLHLTADRRC